MREEEKWVPDDWFILEKCRKKGQNIVRVDNHSITTSLIWLSLSILTNPVKQKSEELWMQHSNTAMQHYSCFCIFNLDILHPQICNSIGLSALGTDLFINSLNLMQFGERHTECRPVTWSCESNKVKNNQTIYLFFFFLNVKILLQTLINEMQLNDTPAGSRAIFLIMVAMATH